MQTFKRFLGAALATTGLLAVPAMAQRNPRPLVENIHLLSAGAANPDSMDIKGRNPKDNTKHILFDKPSGAVFTVQWLDLNGRPGGRTPCTQASIGAPAGSNALCTLKPGAVLCNRGDANHVPAEHACHFRYTTGAGDPDIVIDEGYNGPPPGNKKDVAKKSEPGKK